MNRTRKLELLSPAKNLEQGIAAINYGADALYVGAPRFGAREGATNSEKDVEQLIRYAHRYWAKVFVVMNTIVYEHELKAAEKMARWACDAGADALIVQDMAFLEMGLPPISLHASTQTHNVDVRKVEFLQNVGFERVILARELSLSQIKCIGDATTVELEAFIHGALCVSYSGQCYLSESLVGRSANRGACAQPCRSAYNLVDDSGKVWVKNKHLLSLKDFNSATTIRSLADAGVSSFKIEGRLKNIDYVKNITALYRKELDNILSEGYYGRASSGKVYLGFTPDASKSFNRGFTSYFTQHRPADLTGYRTAKATGALVGYVKEMFTNSFVLEGDSELSNGDGICFISKSGQLVGTNVNRVEGATIFPAKMDGIVKGVALYRNYDHQFSKTLESNPTERLIDAKAIFEYNGTDIVMRVVDEEGVEVSLSYAVELEEAKKHNRAIQTIRQQLEKTGGGIFRITNVDVKCSVVPFIPISVLNGYRREALEMLEAKRVLSLPKRGIPVLPNKIEYPEKVIDYSGNVVNTLSRRFYERHGVTRIADGYELSHTEDAHLMTTKYCIRYELGACLKTDGGTKLPAVLFLENNGKRFRLLFDCNRCRMIVKGTVDK